MAKRKAGETVMHESGENVPPSFDIKGSFHELSVTAYAGRFKVVGVATFGVGLRTSSRRPSDFLRSVNDTRLTLADASIYDARSGDLLDSAPFMVVNLDRVDALYARDDASAGGRRQKEADGSVTEALDDRGGGAAEALDDRRGGAAEALDDPSGSA